MAFKTTDEDDLDLERDAEGTETDTKRSESEIEGREAADSGKDDTERDADDTGDVPAAKESVGFKKRLAKLTAQRNNDRKERDVLAARVAAYEAKERETSERQQKAERETPEGQKAAERRIAIRAAIDETYGPGTSEFIESEKVERISERNLQREQYALNGISHLRSELEDYGIAVNDHILVTYERSVGSELQEDPELLAMFKRPATQREAIAEATKRVIEGLTNPAIKQQGGRPLARIERNRSAVLGAARSQSGADEGSPYPEDYEAKPPKGLKGNEVDEWWQNHREQMWKKLSAADAR